MKKRVAILISGRGSNMQSLIQAAKQADYPAEIIGVISNNPEAKGIESAEKKGIDTAIVERQHFLDKAEYNDMIDAQLRDWNAEIICLAGFMDILGAPFTDLWAGKIINIHPSLLPLYKGLHTHQQALDAGAKTHGCTVHFVTPSMDEGPTILQAEVPVLPDDTQDTLSARVLIEEHMLYPQALAMLARGEANFQPN